MKIKWPGPKGRHQVKFGVWFQRFQSNENIALSQFGQATFPSLAAFLGGSFDLGHGHGKSPRRSVIDPAELALAIQRVLRGRCISREPEIHNFARFPRRVLTGWNEAYGRASNYNFTNGVINTQPTIGNSIFTTNNAGSTSSTTDRFGVESHRDQDRRARRIRNVQRFAGCPGLPTDQNAPFNPTYSIPNLTLDKFPVSLPIVPHSAGTPSPAGTKLVPGGVQPDLKTPTVLSYSLKIEQEISRQYIA